MTRLRLQPHQGGEAIEDRRKVTSMNSKLASSAAELGRAAQLPRPRLGVLATHPIQYHAPLYQEISSRNLVDLDVAFFSTKGATAYHDPAFGKTLTWDVDLLSGYQWTLLKADAGGYRASWLLALIGWLRQHDIVVLHGHSDPRMLLAAAACKTVRVPYLLRGESHAKSSASGMRRLVRHSLASYTVKGAAGALPIGKLNSAFYDRYGHIPKFPAPYSVDNDRFRSVANQARHARRKRLASLDLDPQRPVVIFSGKLIPRKRPMDVVQAIKRCEGKLSLLIIGDGPLWEEIRPLEAQLPIRCLGFVNQSDIPRWYACGDVLALPSEKETWGVTVNEGMACGLVPVVSDAVGCAPDLVEGVGEVVPVGDVSKLTRALLRASDDTGSKVETVRKRLECFTITETACGYERAALALRSRHRSGG